MKKLILDFISVALFLSIFLALSTSAYSQDPYEFVLKWGVQGTGDGQFLSIHGVVVDSNDNVYVADRNNYCIQKFDSNGIFLLKWGSLGIADGQFDRPLFLAVDSSDNIFVGDTYNYRVQKFDSNGNFLFKWGEYGSGDGQFCLVMGVALDSYDNVYVVDHISDRIQKFDSNGVFLFKWGSYPYLNNPTDIAEDSLDNIYVTDRDNVVIRKYDSLGNQLLVFGSLGIGDGQFARPPGGLAVDSSDNVYVSDPNNHRIQMFDSNGVFLGWWGLDNNGYTGWHEPGTGTWGVSGSGDGQFNFPVGMDFDSSGNIYVVERGNFRIQKFSPPNQPPIAVCQDIEIPADENGQAGIIAEDVDGGSYDPDEDDTFTLSIDNIGPFSLGKHYVNLTVTDDCGESDTCQATVTVVDISPPIIESVTVEPSVLWPPNHKMVLITPTIIASDSCDPNPVIELTSITMNEGDETNTYDPNYDPNTGDGNTTNDIEVDEDGNIYLRAERKGNGPGRVYTITYTATDASGNSSSAIATVTVPHDQ